MTLKRLVVGLLAAALLLIVVSFIFFSLGDSEPGRGNGDPIEQPASP